MFEGPNDQKKENNHESRRLIKKYIHLCNSIYTIIVFVSISVFFFRFLFFLLLIFDYDSVIYAQRADGVGGAFDIAWIHRGGASCIQIFFYISTLPS